MLSGSPSSDSQLTQSSQLTQARLKVQQLVILAIFRKKYIARVAVLQHAIAKKTGLFYLFV